MALTILIQKPVQRKRRALDSPGCQMEASTAKRRRAGPRFKTTHDPFQFLSGDIATFWTQDFNVNSVESLEPIHEKEDVKCVFGDGRLVGLPEDLSEPITSS